MKAYATRVGSGPFPTELLDDVGAGSPSAATRSGRRPGGRGGSAGSTPVSARYAVAVNSVSSIMLNKLDILSGVDPIRLCVAYEIDGGGSRRGRRPRTSRARDARLRGRSRAGASRSTTSGRWRPARDARAAT
jgi:adenylosuccinate synthase